MAELSLERGLEILDRRSLTVRYVVFAYIVLTLAYCAILLGELAGSIDLDSEEPGGIELAAIAIALIYSIAYIVSAILIARWIYLAHSNVRASGQRLDISPGWAVGWFFVPFANLVKPFHAMRDLWNASRLEHDYFTKESDPLIKAWWGCWIVGNIIGTGSIRFTLQDDAAAQTTGNILDLVSSVLLIPAAWLLVKIVERINAAQRSTLSASSTFG